MRACAIVAAGIACSSSGKPPPPPPPMTVEVATLHTAPVVDATEYLATLRSRLAATIQPRVQGQITEIYVKPGDHVVVDQPLAKIDPGSQPAAVAQARASYASRRAALELAETNLERTRKLVDEQALPRQNLDDAQAAATSARADLAALGAQIASTQVQLRYYTILSPGAGIVGDIPGRIGDSVTMQTVLTTVTDNSALEANVSVPVDRAREITTATRIDLVGDTSQVVGGGTVTFVSAQVNPETQSVLVKAAIDNAKGLLRADQIVRARVVWHVRPGLTVPALAVTRVGGQSFVYLVDQAAGHEVARQRPVELGDLVDNRYVVLKGVRDGDQIAVSAIQKLRDGAPIPDQRLTVFVDFFIKRPILAAVVAILITLGGALAIPTLPVARYPSLAAPQIIVSSIYIGASSQVVESAVTTPLEDSINGVEGMRYIQSASTSDGLSQVTVTFEPWRDIDLAAVDVQNRVQQALPRLPADVRATGVVVTKSSTSIVLAAAFYTDHDEYSSIFVSNYVDRYVRDELLRIPGVGEARNFTPRTYAMRVWLDPPKLAARGLTTDDIVRALREQNLEIPAGQLGKEPAPAGQAMQISVQAAGRLPDTAAFERMIVKTGTDGTLVQLKDVGRVELGAEDYGTALRIDNHDAIGLGIFQLPNANALDVERAVNAKLAELSKRFPPGLRYSVGFDPTTAVQSAIDEVLVTLGLAILIVIAVIYLFLQGWRATVIPAITIPVSLIGTFMFVKLFGFSINLLTLFGLTLATGLVVDDAIVVIENIERHLHGEHKGAAEAASRAMKEVAGVVVATSLVLVAVFVPVSFFPGTTGRIYQQFALTIAFSISLSAINALTLSPALASRLLRERTREKRAPFRVIDRAMARTTDGYGRLLGRFLRHRVLVLAVFVGALALTAWTYTRVPSAFVPDEDQGYLIIAVQGPSGASLQQTIGVTKQVEQILNAQPEVEHVFNVNGFSFAGPGSNRAILFVGLRPFSDCKGSAHGAQAVLGRVRGPLMGLGGAFVVPFLPPSVQGVGVFGGFQLEIEDREGGPPGGLAAATFALVGAANQDPRVHGVLATFTVDDPQLQVSIDRERAKSLGVSLDQIASALQVELGSSYVNDFDLGDRSFRVYVQADARYRSDPAALHSLYVRSASGALISLDELVHAKPGTAPQVITHYNLFRAAEIDGSPAPGTSSADAMTAMEELGSHLLPAGMTSEWAGLSLEQQRAGHQIALLFALAIVVAYLVLAAQYESFVLPLIVLFAVPLALLGALALLAARGLATDVFAQIGMVMLVGLASKNAILIVEFAEQLRAQGRSIADAAIEAAKIRLRPILMTSLAFILGVLPLVVASGSGAASRRSLGTTVFGGMILSSVLNLAVIPVLYTVIERAREHRRTPGTLGQ